MMRWLLIVGALWLFGCSSAYYGTMEQFGVYKRDILVSRVEKARDSQKDAQKSFDSALAQFASVVRYDGGALEAQYERLNNAYQRSEKAAADVDGRIKDIERVAKDLFKEWQQELDQYSAANLRADSERQLRATQREYTRLLQAMKNVQAKIPPVLRVFHDHVLYLKHNLNARAIAALDNEYRTVARDVSRLMADMETAIAEADAFIARMAN